jgi:predicted RNA-binding protein with PUA domain
MSSDFPTFAEAGEENIRGYLRRKKMQTVYHTSPAQFCVECKETGGDLFQAPLQFWCMAMECPTPEKRCEFVKHGGVRP